MWRGKAGRVGLLAGLGGVLFGDDTGVIGSAQLFIEKDFHLSNFSDELLVGTVLAGARWCPSTSTPEIAPRNPFLAFWRLSCTAWVHERRQKLLCVSE